MSPEPVGAPGPVPGPPPGPVATGWRRLHPVTIVRELLTVAWNVVIAVFAFGALRGDAVARVELVVPIAAFALATARYLSTRYQVTPEAVLWHRGVLVRQRVEVRRDRIQNVASGADVLGRIFDLRTVTISTAGSEGEINLALVTNAEATFLLGELLGRRPDDPLAVPPPPGHGVPALPPAPPPVQRVVSLSNGQLLLYALSRNATASVVALAASVAVVAVTGSPGPVPVLLFVVAAPLLGVLDLFDFRLYAEPDRVRVRHGLLKTRDKWARRDRIQVLTVDRPLLRSRLGYETVSVATADATVDGDSTLTMCHPLAPRGQWPQLAGALLERPQLAEADLRPISPRAELRRFVRFLVAGVLLAAAPVVVVGVLVGPTAAVASGVPLVAGAAVAARLLARRAQRFDGYALDPDHLLIRRGMVGSRLWLVRRAKVQSALVTASPFQRRLGLASVLVDAANVSGGAMVVPDLPQDEARAVAAELVELADRVFLPDGV